jgi:hypothetical protein
VPSSSAASKRHPADIGPDTNLIATPPKRSVRDYSCWRCGFPLRGERPRRCQRRLHGGEARAGHGMGCTPIGATASRSRGGCRGGSRLAEQPPRAGALGAAFASPGHDLTRAISPRRTQCLHLPPRFLCAKNQALQWHERLDVNLNRSVSWRARALVLAHAPTRCHPNQSQSVQCRGVCVAKSNRTAVGPGPAMTAKRVTFATILGP